MIKLYNFNNANMFKVFMESNKGTTMQSYSWEELLPQKARLVEIIYALE